LIDILMAVYNGEKFLAEQIESILAQDTDGWRLYICDDRSADGSFEIALQYAEKYPELITAYRNDKPSGSACANFIGMLKKSQSEYVMFSDQDDFWKPAKVRLTLAEMNRLEQQFGECPLLVHTEMEVVDAQLNVLEPRFTRYQGINPAANGLNRLLAQNNVTGCTTMINRSLADIIKNAPSEKMLMHDWWAGIAAAAFGHIGFVSEPLNMYRQHGGNQLGAVNNRSASAFANAVKNTKKLKARVNATYEQAQAFLDEYGDILPPQSKKTAEIYASMQSRSKLARIWRVIRFNFRKQNFMTAVGQLFFC